LHPAAQRVEQRRGGQRGGGHCYRCLEREHLGGQDHQPGEHTGKHSRDDGVRDHPADDAVDRVEPVLQHRHADADRQGRRPEVEQIVDHRRPRSGAIPQGQRDNEDAKQHGDQENSAAAVEPLELLAALIGRPPVAGYLHDKPGEQGRYGPDGHCGLENRPGPALVGGEAAVGGDADIVPGDGHHPGSRGGQPE